MSTAEDILNTILAAWHHPGRMAPEDRSYKAAIAVLEDGEALAALGFGDADQDDLEWAHAKAKSLATTCACCN